MRLRKGQKVQITSNHSITERGGVHHGFNVGDCVTVDYDVDTTRETPLLVDDRHIKQFVKPDCFKVL